MPTFTFHEFFAGGGMARAGLGADWRCLFANDLDPMKARAYGANWGGEALVRRDVADLAAADLPGAPDLVWASFPCQDLSLAGDRQGLGHPGANRLTRSGTFWPFWRLVRALGDEGRAPPIVVLENVPGVLTSKSGADFAAIARALAAGSYRFGALMIDARAFTPQSRPRVFFVAVARDLALPRGLVGDAPCDPWAPARLRAAHARLGPALSRAWLWWRLATPSAPAVALADIVEDAPAGAWHDADHTQKLLDQMSPANHRKLEIARADGRRVVGTLFRRTRPSPAGGSIVRAEARFDGVAGCLRTPAGGSSRQTLMIVEGASVRTRLVTAREAARLMGLADSYILPHRAGDAHHLLGDGVAPPVVRHLARHLLEPLALSARAARRAAAA